MRKSRYSEEQIDLPQDLLAGDTHDLVAVQLYLCRSNLQVQVRTTSRSAPLRGPLRPTGHLPPPRQ